MEKLISEARARGLGACAELLDGEKLEAAPADAALAAPVEHDPLKALDQMRRRGLAPELVDVMWKFFEGRPLELGLFAWDVLCGSILRSDDTKTLARLREAARAVSDVIPEPGRAFISTRRLTAYQLVERVAVPAFQALSEKQQLEGARVNALAALEINVAVSEPNDLDLARTLEAARQLGRYFSLAHLPMLATFYLNYLWVRCGYKAALDDYLEAMLDADAHGHYPTRDELLLEGSVDELERVGYMLGRDAVQLDAQGVMIDDFRKAPKPLDYTKPAAEVARTFQRSHLVHAELFLDVDEQPVPFDVINEVVKLNPAWRYAGRVRLALLARLAKPESTLPLQGLDGFLAAFGNELGVWTEMDRYSPAEAKWIDGFNARIVREVSALPHDRVAWQSLGIAYLLSDDQEAWKSAVTERVLEQCKL